jgi:hypothetical protein
VVVVAASVHVGVTLVATGDEVETKIFEVAPSLVVQFTTALVDAIPETATPEIVGAVTSTTGVVEVP